MHFSLDNVDVVLRTRMTADSKSFSSREITLKDLDFERAWGHSTVARLLFGAIYFISIIASCLCTIECCCVKTYLLLELNLHKFFQLNVSTLILQHSASYFIHAFKSRWQEKRNRRDAKETFVVKNPPRARRQSKLR